MEHYEEKEFDTIQKRNTTNKIAKITNNICIFAKNVYNKVNRTQHASQ